jgi:hypothetical protein
MYKFDKYICWPEPLKSKYSLDWTGYGDQDVYFKVFCSREKEGPFVLVLITPFPGAVIEYEKILILLDGGVNNTDYVQSIDFGSPSTETLGAIDANDGSKLEKQQNLNFVDDLWFYVSAVSTLNQEIERTDPFRWAHEPTRQHFLNYREIIRRTELDINRFLGARRGLLFRLKTFGQLAKNVNPILETNIGSEDDESFGEKYHMGYLPPIEMKCGYTNEQGEKDLSNVETGTTDVRRVGIVLLPHPIIRPNDVWVNLDTNDRFVVMKGVKTPTFRGLPLRQIATISMLPRTDKAYNLELI